MARILIWCLTGIVAFWPAAAQAQVHLGWKFKENDRFFAEWTFFKLDCSRQGTQLSEGVEELKLVSRFTVLKAEPERLVLEQQFGLVNVRHVGAAGNGITNLFKNAVLQVTLGKDCKVERIEGIEPLLGIQPGNAPLPQQKNMLEGLENIVRLWLQHVFIPLPDREVRPDAGWTEKIGLTGAVFGLEKTYSYKGAVKTVQGQLHQVDVQGKAHLRSEEVEKKRLKELVITESVSTGTALIDAEQGRLVQGKFRFRIGFRGLLQLVPEGRPTTLQNETDLFVTVRVSKQNPLDSTSSPAIRLVSSQSEAAQLPKDSTTSLGMKLVLVPAGKFSLGAKAFGQQEPDEPVEVEIARPFYMGAHEITIGQYRRFTEATGYKTEAERKKVCIGFDKEQGKMVAKATFSWKNPGWDHDDRHPAVNLSWEDAKEFCQWLSKKENKNYRLPTEAEWEYACRAGTKTTYASGDEPESLAAFGNVVDVSAKKLFPQWQAHRSDDGYVFTAPVGSFKPNAFGLYDMHGNALEWCEDWYFPYPRGSVMRDPQGAPLGLQRVQRGGSFADFPQQCTSAHRTGFPVHAYSISSGFRVVLADGPPQPFARRSTWAGQDVLPRDPDILATFGKNSPRPLPDPVGRVFQEHFGLLRVSLGGADVVVQKEEVLPVNEAIALYTERLKETVLPHLYLLRAAGQRSLGKRQEALADLGEAIQLDDKNPWLFYHRAILRQEVQQYEGAIKDYEKAVELKEESYLTHNALSWLLATCPEARVRDGKKALEHARRARQLSRVRDGNLLDTLAAAYAELGDFEEAVRWETEALDDAAYVQIDGEAARQRLKLYQDKKAYRQPSHNVHD